MKCKQCKQEIDENVSFCPHCGAKKQEIRPLTQEEIADSFKELDKKIALYKRLMSVMSLAFLVLPFVSLNIFLDGGIIAIVIVFVVLSAIEGFLGHRVAKLNREKDLLRYNCGTNQQPQTVEQGESYDHFDNKEPYPNSTGNAVKTAETQADKDITGYLRFNCIFSAIIYISVFVFGLILLFVPFFSVIIDDVSVYTLAESSMLWNIENANEMLYSDILEQILQEGKITNYVIDVFDEGSYEMFGISCLFFFLIPLISPIIAGKEMYKMYKYKTNENFKNAVIYKYNNEKAPSYARGSLLILGIMLLFGLPAIEFLFHLPKYFEGLTSGFYMVALVCFLLLYACIFVSGVVLSKKYKQVMFAFSSKKR